MRFNELTEQRVEESGLQYYTGVKKHGKEYMTKAAQAARDGASQEELGALKDRLSKAHKGKAKNESMAEGKARLPQPEDFDSDWDYQEALDAYERSLSGNDDYDYENMIDEADHRTWYVRIDGIIESTPYQGKAAANAAGLELKKQPGNENKLFMLTTKA